ncbi:uncharacterized protein EI97DRAFT_171559 [Westerdykella ornata]|uniref:FHA domain-containing protein n=1 Tax=Westerdykella ornata TaxID=318751 RepID=A0A6A6JT36_WESOR|nr:uncharacterized protein EI97DRAFT_171559 [Westerdykella ornata]KAF2279283.1 hypothetical protein EI97DRAFT_171559 [Westerdykella ornata]
MDSSLGNGAMEMPSASHELRPEPRPTPSLLPAFEPLSSSPFPRPQSGKRKFEEASPSYSKQPLKYYPTPVPTSSTGILPSSSPRNERPTLGRTISTLTERVPLGTIPKLQLPEDGEVMRLGRSSNSSNYQLSANRLISRVHVQAAYHPPSASYPQGHVEVECLGWNGAKVHCGGRIFELSKGDTYVSENPGMDIMLDVQSTRVMIVWPRVASASKNSWDSEEDEEEEEALATPTRRTGYDHLPSSPPLIPRSPVSQSPIRQPDIGRPQVGNSPAPYKIYEDSDDGEAVLKGASQDPAAEQTTFVRPALSQSDSKPQALQASLLSSLASDDYSDGDEENDPVVHSFGPFGQNILSRLDSFSTDNRTPRRIASPTRPRRSTVASPSPKRPSSDNIRFKESPVKNHVINQLAFSRVHSLPLSTIHSNLPGELKAAISPSKSSTGADSNDPTTPTRLPQLTKEDLKKIMDDIPCVGEIPRSGKDAAGKPLENEFYYVPEMDTNEIRRETVTNGMRGSGLRAVRNSVCSNITGRGRVFESMQRQSPPLRSVACEMDSPTMPTPLLLCRHSSNKTNAYILTPQGDSCIDCPNPVSTTSLLVKA